MEKRKKSPAGLLIFLLIFLGGVFSPVAVTLPSMSEVQNI